MKNYTISKLTFFLVVALHSCKTKNDFRYSENKVKYSNVIGCIRKNIPLLFPNSKKENSISIHAKDENQIKICEGLFDLMYRNSIEFFTIDRDSTIAFYSSVAGGLKSKQMVLIFIGNQTKIENKLSRNLKLICKRDSNCFELERIVSLAD